MSWQAYVDTSLVGSGHCDCGAIFNLEGTSVWAATKGYDISPTEIKEIITSFTAKEDANGIKAIQGTGFHVAGEKFITLRTDERSLYGKKGKEGVCCVKTKQAVIVVHYGEQHQPGGAANTVEQLADYLIGLGF